MNRRNFIGFLGGVSALTVSSKAFAFDLFGLKKSERAMKDFPFKLTDAEWRERLTEEQYRIMRMEGTEPTCSSPLEKESRAGIYHCAGCGQELFSNNHKFESGTGWPSFWDPIRPEAVGTSTDYKIGYARTEVHCSNCGSHLGHVFEDGPPPTGLRYCINGVAMKFFPDKTS